MFGTEDGERFERNSENLEFFLRRGEKQQERTRRFNDEWDSTPTLSMFYRDLYGIEKYMSCNRTVKHQRNQPLLVNHRDRERPYEAYEDLEEFRMAVKDETSFIYMGRFWTPPNGYLTARRNATIAINGFCVDLDRVEDDKGFYLQLEWVMNTLLEKLDESPEVMPNYLMLSGTGSWQRLKEAWQGGEAR